MRFVKVFLRLCAVAAPALCDIVYITDINAYSSLAPCAASAVSYVVQDLTNSQCPPLVTALESCACTKDQNAAGIASSISSNVLYSCGTTATDDVSSASVVFSRYCNQGAPVSSTPSAPTLVSEYITDLAAFFTLGPCAASALSYVVQQLTDSDCPPGASALASCACNKNQNSLAASGSINSAVFYSCGSTHTEDISSAQAVFAGYCGMNAGTTSFPTASGLAGNINYYITDLPIYSSLAPCASSAVSYAVLSQTYDDCPNAPGDLVSCVCVKDQNSLDVTGSIKSGVSYSCGSTASADVTSALDVFGFYCNAGKGSVVATGVTAAVTQANTGGGSKPTAGPGVGTGAFATSTSASAAEGPGNGAKIGAIVGGAVGGIALIAIIGAIWVWRSRRGRRPPTVSNVDGPSGPKPDDKMLVAHEYIKMSTPPLKAQDGIHGVPDGPGAYAELVTPLGTHPSSPQPTPAPRYSSPVYGMQGRYQNPPHELPPAQGQANYGPVHEMPPNQGQMNYGPVYGMPPRHGRTNSRPIYEAP